MNKEGITPKQREERIKTRTIQVNQQKRFDLLAEKCFDHMSFEESTCPTRLKTIDLLIHYLLIAAEISYITPQSGP